MRHLLFGLLTTLLIGCDSSPQGEMVAMCEIDDYSLTLLSNRGGSVSSRSDGSVLSVTLDKYEVRIDQDSGNLSFNGNPVGRIAKGDKVIVDARGRIFVNGKAR